MGEEPRSAASFVAELEDALHIHDMEKSIAEVEPLFSPCQRNATVKIDSNVCAIRSVSDSARNSVARSWRLWTARIYCTSRLSTLQRRPAARAR